MIIRPFADTDRAFAADLIAAEWPHRAGETIPLREGDYLPNAPRWTAADPGSDEPRAYASLWRVAGDRFRMDLVVDPAWRRRGTGSRMLETIVEAAASAGAATLQARTYASDAESLRFLERRGFAETMRMQGMRLDVRETDAERLAAYQRRAAAQGFAITTLTDAQRSGPSAGVSCGGSMATRRRAGPIPIRARGRSSRRPTKRSSPGWPSSRPIPRPSSSS